MHKYKHIYCYVQTFCVNIDEKVLPCIYCVQTFVCNEKVDIYKKDEGTSTNDRISQCKNTQYMEYMNIYKLTAVFV